MKTIINLALSLALTACGGDNSQPSQEPNLEPSPRPVQDASPERRAPGASTPPLDGGTGRGDGGGEACALSVDSIDPTGVFYGQAHNTIVVARGCGFLGVRDVEVNVGSVPFRAIDDHTLVFLAAAAPLDTSVFEYPMTVQVDILRIQPDQVQTFFTWTAK